MSEPQPRPSGEPADDEEEPFPEPAGLADELAEPAGLADELFALNVRETRERLKLSQGEVARRMADRGFPFYQQTIRRIEDGRRKVSVGEAKALGEILKTPMERLTWPGREAAAVSILDTAMVRVQQAHDEIGRWTEILLWALAQLQTTVGETERDDWLGSTRICDLVAKARQVLQLTPEDAVAAARHDHENPRSWADDERS